jgi:DNA-binding winged helix-turn-helix (wHTH) protein/tetratricopeptide (TPR) repeat protein
MEQQTAAAYRFGPFLLEPVERRITKESVPIELTTKAFDLLALLVARHGGLVTKEEIFDTVWGDVSVTESNLSTTVSVIRKALGENAVQQRYIETVSKKGYRFVAVVQEIGDVASVANGASDKHLDPPELPQSSRRNWPKLAIGITVVVFTAAIACWLFWPKSNRTADDLYRQAVECDRRGDDKLSLETLNEALRIRPDFPEASLRAGWIAFQDDADDEAVKYAQRAAESSEGEADQTAHGRCTRLKAQGLQLLLNGDSENAMSKFRLASESDPTDTDALYYFSATAADGGLLDAAEHSLLKCQSLDRNNPFCTFQMMEIRVRQNHFDAAIGEYDRASKQGDLHPWLEEPAGYAELARGNINAALSHFHRLEADGHQLASGVHFRASQDGIAAAYLYEGRLEDARSQLVSALQTSRSPYDKAAYYLFLARIDALHNRMAEARQEVGSAVKLSQSEDLAMSAARTLAVAGDIESARNLLHQHQQAGPALGKSFAATQQFVSGIEGIALKHDLRRGVTELADAYRFESDPEIAYYLARAQMQAKRLPDAIRIFTEILDDKGSVLVDSVPSLIPLAEYNIAACYRQQGDLAKAAKHLNAAEAAWTQADPELKRAVLPR